MGCTHPTKTRATPWSAGQDKSRPPSSARRAPSPRGGEGEGVRLGAAGRPPRSPQAVAHEERHPPEARETCPKFVNGGWSRRWFRRSPAFHRAARIQEVNRRLASLRREGRRSEEGSEQWVPSVGRPSRSPAPVAAMRGRHTSSCWGSPRAARCAGMFSRCPGSSGSPARDAGTSCACRPR